MYTVPDWYQGSDSGRSEEAVDDTLHIGAARVARPEWLPGEVAEAERAWNGYLSGQAAVSLDQFEAQVAASVQGAYEAGLTEIAAGANEAAGAAVAEASAAVGSGDGELPGPGVGELAEIVVATLSQWQNPARASGISPSVISAWEPTVSQLWSEWEQWGSHLPPQLG
ncbi:hypothetical protein FG87_34605 [Nocardia vulneris]|uniref:PPE family domain-containing protein n=2 Tax=Nocardia vulneris TaxID=1141657 RepID=A0ABR4Z6B4_9NOCA|nr:hypothetical protein FG87_34605 [Nocardia vulneris]